MGIFPQELILLQAEIVTRHTEIALIPKKLLTEDLKLLNVL